MSKLMIDEEIKRAEILIIKNFKKYEHILFKYILYAVH